MYEGEALKDAARDFIEQFYSLTNRSGMDVLSYFHPCTLLHAFTRRMHSAEHSIRLDEVLGSIDETGSYELTKAELEFGSKVAWRNAPRCINRIVWNSLHVILGLQ